MSVKPSETYDTGGSEGGASGGRVATPTQGSSSSPHARCAPRHAPTPRRFPSCTDCAIVAVLAAILTRALLALIRLPRGAR
eukprot:1323271-Prymnesium_polylepis.1